MGCGSSTSGTNDGRSPVKQSSDPEKRAAPRYYLFKDEDLSVQSAAPHEVTDHKKDKQVSFMGRTTAQIDVRSAYKEVNHQNTLDVQEEGELWIDPDFPVQKAMKGLMKRGIDWKRPAEFCENPCLFSDGSTRFDVGQGAIGDCWFLSILAAVADNQEILKQVIPEDAYKIGTPHYNGIFHCRFWKFGEWVDVYVDDFLPVLNGRPWGAKSASDPNEIWVSLMEKAFAKFHGSYQDVFGGSTADAFISLTGGLAEKIEIGKVAHMKLYRRLKNALASGSVIACNIPDKYGGRKGLIGDHAYTLSGVAKVKYEDKMQPLVRVRNPWGSQEGEWTGAWSDSSTEWKHVPEETLEELNISRKADGEFWMSMNDFCKNFSEAQLCNLTPDFDNDGITDGLDRVTMVLGEWAGSQAAGSQAILDNPRFIFTVPDSGMDADGTTPIVLQLVQPREAKRSDEQVSMRLDLFKVDKESEGVKTCLLLDERTNMATYMKAWDTTYRYRLEPGKYVLIPSTYYPEMEKAFLIRIFSSQQTQCSELPRSSSLRLFVREADNVVDYQGNSVVLEKMSHDFGEWKEGISAGGQISNDTYDINPQYVLNIPDAQLILVSLAQDQEEPELAIGFRFYKVDESISTALTQQELYSLHDICPPTISGRQVFIFGREASGEFFLQPGTYVLLLFTDRAGDEKRFALTLCSENELPCRKIKKTCKEVRFEKEVARF